MKAVDYLIKLNPMEDTVNKPMYYKNKQRSHSSIITRYFKMYGKVLIIVALNEAEKKSTIKKANVATLNNYILTPSNSEEFSSAFDIALKEIESYRLIGCNFKKK